MFTSRFRVVATCLAFCFMTVTAWPIILGGQNYPSFITTFSGSAGFSRDGAEAQIWETVGIDQDAGYWSTAFNLTGVPRFMESFGGFGLQIIERIWEADSPLYWEPDPPPITNWYMWLSPDSVAAGYELLGMGTYIGSLPEDPLAIHVNAFIKIPNYLVPEQPQFSDYADEYAWAIAYDDWRWTPIYCNFTLNQTPVRPIPEPTTLCLLGLGGPLLLMIRKRKFFGRRSSQS